MRLKAEYGAPDARRERVRLAAFIALMLVAGFVLRAVAGPPTLPNHLPSLVQVRDVLGGAVIPLDTLAAALAALAWLLWLWVTVSLALELLLVAAEAAAHGAAWVRALRRVADRLSMPVARRAVAAAFAFQVLSRAVPAAAAPLLPAEQAWTVDVGETTSPAEDARTPVDAVRAPASAYRVRSGDTLWSIAEAAYGSGSEYRRLVAANLGRVMLDGTSFSASGVIRPGWVLDVPEPSRWIEAADGQRWYTVEAGDTLSDIAARVLGDAERWPELFELNRDVATLDDGRTLVRPELIWPGLRLRLPSEAHVAVEVEPEPVVLGSAMSSSAVTEEPPPSPPLSVVVPDTEPPIGPAVETAAPPPLVRDPHPLPPIDPQASTEPDDELPDVPDTGPASPGLPVLALVGLAGAAGLATLGVRRWRRLRPLPQEPENEVVVDGGYAEAQLTHDFARQLQGGVTFDLANTHVSHLLRLLDEYNLGDVEAVALRHGRSSTTISLAAKLSDQSMLLDLAPIFAERLQAEAEAWVSSDQDVQLRLSRVRKTRLLPAAAGGPAKREPPWFVPLGVLYDRQLFSAAWPAVGHLLVASLPGRGAETILTSLLATLTAHRSPHELRAWLVARPRTLPAPVDELPHLDATIDPHNPEDLAGLLARLRAELDQRALGGAWPELVIIVPELSSLGERAAELQLLLGAAAAGGVRLIAGTSDPIAAMQSPLLSAFTTRMVLHMAAEEASVALLGTADAAFLGGGGRLLLRLDGREPVELYGYQVAPDHLERLVRVMRSAYLAPPVFAAAPEPPSPQPPPETEDVDDDAEPGQCADATSTPGAPAPISLAPVESSNMPVQVFCFGAPRVLYAGRQVWPKASVGEIKPWEMLLFIACQPPEGVAREQLAQAIWPDDPGDDELLIHRVRQLRYRLRSHFSAVVHDTVSDGICLERFGPPYLDQTIAHSDAQEFLDVTQQARTQPGPDSIPLLERARALYTGDLLFGPDTRRYAWADERDASGVTLREHYRRRLQQATVTLAELYAQLGRIDDAVELYREVSDADPGDDRAWRALFQMHAGRGDLPSLMREERRLRAALRDLAVRAGERAQSAATEPSIELQREYQRLLATIEGRRRAASAG